MRLFASNQQGWGQKGSVEDLVRAQGEALSLVHSSMGHEDFLRHCIEALPHVGEKRDTRRQRLVRAMRRMHDRGDLPFRVEGDLFVFD